MIISEFCRVVFKLYLIVWNVTLKVILYQERNLLKLKRCLNLVKKKNYVDLFILCDDTCDSHFSMLRLFAIIVGLFSFP